MEYNNGMEGELLSGPSILTTLLKSNFASPWGGLKGVNWAPKLGEGRKLKGANWAPKLGEGRKLKGVNWAPKRGEQKLKGVNWSQEKGLFNGILATCVLGRKSGTLFANDNIF